MPSFPAPRPVTSGPNYHFFGYYEKTPWSADGRHLLALETTFMDRRPGPDDVAVVGMVESAHDCRFVPLSETRAWNWQQGCMLQWLPGSPDEIIFNDREEDQFVARIQNVRTGARRTLPAPVYAVSPNGREAFSLSFSRLFDVRPGYGYAGVPDRWDDQLCPEDDGLYRVDLLTGEARLILSLEQAAALGKPGPGMETGKHRFNHCQVSPQGTRIAVLHRWSVDREVGRDAPWLTRLLTMNPDGSDPYIPADEGMISHYDWRDENHLLAWARQEPLGNRYYLFTDRTGDARVVGEGVLTVDGHCSYSPDRRWILTDTYPNADGFRTLLLFDPETARRVDIGQFHGPTPADVEIRCDLHPRWSRDGCEVCIDSVHENGQRQVYVVPVAGIVD